MAARSVRLTPDNLAILTAGGHPVYLVRAPDAPFWDYHKPIRVKEMPGILLKRHLLMYETKGHREALELEVVSGAPPQRSALLGCTLEQD